MGHWWMIGLYALMALLYAASRKLD
jgi:hypothetical protein